jgi:hypothetical protein
MTMFQLDDFAAARERVRDQGVREVFEVSLDDMEEVHLHPADMRGAIVSVSRPSPPESWRWGGPQWTSRSASVRVAGATIAVADTAAVAARWESVLGAPPSEAGVGFVEDPDERGLVEVLLEADGGEPFQLGGVRFSFQ